MRLVCAIGLWATLAWASHAGAFSTNEEVGRQHTAGEVARFVENLEQELSERRAVVALIARNGRPSDSLPSGVMFTHTAFAVLSRVEPPDGGAYFTYRMHNLYQDPAAPGRSVLASDYLFDFFAPAVELTAGVVVPEVAVQRRLLAMVGSRAYQQLHNPDYSAISNPHTAHFQNCTEFVLDVVNASLYETTDRTELKQISAMYFEPQALAVNSLTLALSALVTPDIRITDHDGPALTATFGSLARYFHQHALMETGFVASATPASDCERCRAGLALSAIPGL